MASVSEDHLRLITTLSNPKGQVVSSILILFAIILFNSFIYIFQPYDGMEVYQEGPLGEVYKVYPGGPAENAGVVIGDQIKVIAGKPVNHSRSEPRYPPGLKPGEVVDYEFQRGNERITLSMTIGSYFDNLTFLGSFLGIQILSIALWGLGLVLTLFAAPDDVRARLLSLGFLLAGLTAAVGGASGWNSFSGVNTAQKVLFSLLASIIVAAHLSFPTVSFPKYGKRVIYAAFLLAGILSMLVIIDDWFLMPRGYSLYAAYGIYLRQSAQIFFVTSWLAAIALMIRNHFLSHDQEVRRQTGIIIWGMVLGIGPFLVLTLLPYLLLGEEYLTGYYTILFLFLLPMAYAYVIFQRRLLKVDFIINRIVVWFTLILLILIASILVFSVIVVVFNLSPLIPIYGGLVTALIALPITALSKVVQKQVDRVLYGSHYDFITVTSSLSNQLAQALDRNRLIELLVQSLPQQMGIQRASLFIRDGNRLERGGDLGSQKACFLDDAVCKELLKHHVPVRAAHLWSQLLPVAKENWAEFDWGQVYVPLILKGDLQGILILGQHISGNIYSDQDLHIIATVAEQGALAITNILLVEKLRGLTQQLVRSVEEERKRLASDLHDTVLQELFYIKQGLYKDPANPDLIDYLKECIQNLRRTIKAQRPPLLDHGLPLALEGLVEDMQKVAGASTTIYWSSNFDGALDLTDEQATSFYRIAQEALNNAVKHSRARYIEVSLEQDANQITHLRVSDDGIGTPWVHESGQLDTSHFGLVFMQERALMIDAKLHILAVPGEGTTVELEI